LSAIIHADQREIGNTAHVAVLLCSYNGQHFIAEQLESIAAQSHHNWKVWVSDDGSSDGTVELLAAYGEKWGRQRIEVVRGPGRGFAANFLSLACRSEIAADYYAYSDQDDVWEPEKLRRALSSLRPCDREHPALYCARTRLVDEKGTPTGFSPLFSQAPDFRNALVQNIGGGNTMVFNDAARALLLRAGSDLRVVAHDWWTYLAVTAAGGSVVYDPVPTLLYRQHGSNLIGSNRGLAARTLRVRQLFRGQLRGWIDANLSALNRIVECVPTHHRTILQHFSRARDGRLCTRLCALRLSGVFRQTLLGNVGLVIAAVFKKL
jgi:glycosyltransferase involved in cell wall biosynthesis